MVRPDHRLIISKLDYVSIDITRQKNLICRAEPFAGIAAGVGSNKQHDALARTLYVRFEYRSAPLPRATAQNEDYAAKMTTSTVIAAVA